MAELTEEQKNEIASLQRRIEEIKSGLPINYELVEVVPDCGGGIKDYVTTIAIAPDIRSLQEYAQNEIDKCNHIPELDGKKPKGQTPCETWYTIKTTKVQVIF